MSLKLMYITNNCEVAEIAERYGVDRVFIDLETIGKKERQGGMDTVQSKHTVEDIKNIRKVVKESELLVRCNPLHDNSEGEINKIAEFGADIVMLPYFKTVEEVGKFLGFVNGRAKTCLLFETPEAVRKADEILELNGIDEVYIGLNDLSLGYGKSFMFELLADGTVEKLANKFRKKGIPFGFGGIAAIGSGMLPAEMILKEHYRLGSTSVILSRSFCNYEKINDVSRVEGIFKSGLYDLRSYENEIETKIDFGELVSNRDALKETVNRIKESMVKK